MAQKTKDELIIDIQSEIKSIDKIIDDRFGHGGNSISDATNRVAISNLYIALATLHTIK